MYAGENVVIEAVLNAIECLPTLEELDSEPTMEELDSKPTLDCFAGLSAKHWIPYHWKSSMKRRHSP